MMDEQCFIGRFSYKNSPRLCAFAFLCSILSFFLLYVQGEHPIDNLVISGICWNLIMLPLLYICIRRIKIIVRISEESIFCSYFIFQMKLSWDQIQRAKKIFNPFYKHVLLLKGKSEKVVLNLDLQSQRKEIMQLLRKHIPADRFEDI